jgi:RimJ/RimL family protein N-acetyltransferase
VGQKGLTRYSIHQEWSRQMIVNELYRGARATARKMGVRRAIEVAKGHEPWHSEWVSLGLRRDLQVPFAVPAAKIPVTVRPLLDADWAELFDLESANIPEEERLLRTSRKELAQEGIGSPFVAITDTGEPAYVQWLFTSHENEQMREFFNNVFPHFGPDEMLLEGAFTPEKHRGKGIMPSAMAQIAETAATRGARWVVTFVTEDNIPSLKGCNRAGFTPYIRRSVRWNGLRKTVTFSGLRVEG